MSLARRFGRLFTLCGISVGNGVGRTVYGRARGTFFRELLRLLGLALRVHGDIAKASVSCLVSPITSRRNGFCSDHAYSTSLPRGTSTGKTCGVTHGKL